MLGEPSSLLLGANRWLPLSGHCDSAITRALHAPSVVLCESERRHRRGLSLGSKCATEHACPPAVSERRRGRSVACSRARDGRLAQAALVGTSFLLASLKTLLPRGRIHALEPPSMPAWLPPRRQ